MKRSCLACLCLILFPAALPRPTHVRRGNGRRCRKRVPGSSPISTRPMRRGRPREKVTAEFAQILKYQGQLAESPAQLRAGMETNTRIEKELERLDSYASMKSDQDTPRREVPGL